MRRFNGTTRQYHFSYLTFQLGEEQFGIHVSQVLNILKMVKVTEVPQSTDYMKGVINLRGSVLPVIDIRIKFGMPEKEYTNSTCIIVMDLDMDGETIMKWKDIKIGNKLIIVFLAIEIASIAAL